jgi:hypothetical protein
MYLTNYCSPENLFEQFLRTEEAEEHLIGKKRYTNDTDYPLAPGLPEYLSSDCASFEEVWKKS